MNPPRSEIRIATKKPSCSLIRIRPQSCPRSASCVADRLGQEVEDRVPDGEADHHADHEGHQRPDQPRAQLGQMLDQRRRAVVDLVAGAHPSVFRAGVRRCLGGGASASGGLVAFGSRPRAAAASRLPSQRSRSRRAPPLQLARRRASRALPAVSSRRVHCPGPVASLSCRGRACAASVMSRRSRLTSLTPASSAASSIARWNSRAMPRALAVNWPRRAEHDRQVLRADDDQRHDADDQQFGPADVEHRSGPPPVRLRPCPSAPRTSRRGRRACCPRAPWCRR